MGDTSFRLGDFSINVKSVTVFFADGSKSACRYEETRRIGKHDVFRYKCENALVDFHVAAEGKAGAIGFSIASLKTLDSSFPLEVYLDFGKPSRILALTTCGEVAGFYSNGFGYYTMIAAEKEPKSPKPEDSPAYPRPLKQIEYEKYVSGYPCWTFPVISAGFDEVPPYSIFTLADYGDRYAALLSLTSGDSTTYIEPGLKLKSFIGKSVKNTGLSWMASIAVDENPYRAVENCVKKASLHAIFKPRKMKRTPIFVEKLGWCSWNALLDEDLSHENVVKIVRGLIDRGVRLGWAIIDYGWQSETKAEGLFRRMMSSLSANEKFPHGIYGTAESLKKLGLDLVGLWHTINIHWNGFEENVSKELGVRGFLSKFNDGYVPPPEMDKAFKLYRNFFSRIKNNGVDFVKVDNQWVIHALYCGGYRVGEASGNVELAMQLAAYSNGLDILNCMSMAPENYSNFLFSNVMRVSIDYIPFWKADAKLHTVFSVYNALVFSHIAYPDYDMFMSYDPYARVHAVARVFSGGPIYLTDREPEKTNVDLLKLFVLPDGRLIKVEEPALPTRDVLFRDPYNNPVLLKIASKIGENPVVAVFNVNREGKEIEDSITLDILPFPANQEEHVYYKVFKNECGLLKPDEELRLSLKDLDVEVIVLAPVKNGKAVIGLKEYLLPPSLIEVSRQENGKIFVKSMASGTLLYYANMKFNEKKVKKNLITEL